MKVLTARQFGIMDLGQFEAMMGKFAISHDADLECSGGECVMEDEEADRFTELRMGILPLPTSKEVNQISRRINAETYFVAIAARARPRLAEVSEEHLRNL